MTAWDTDQLAELIRRKHDCLLRLHEMGRSQLQLVASDELTELLLVLAGKQQLLEHLQLIERQLDPFRDQEPDSRRWRSSDDRRRCAELVDRCEGLLAEIVEQERRSEAQLCLRRDEAAARLQDVHRASQARGAYQAPVSGGPVHVDLYSES
jgi:hypothetical protein